MRIALLYLLFGALSMAANLAAQAGAHRLWPPAPGAADLAYWAALGLGTGVGLVVKYLLDKRWIFADRSRGLAAHSRRFTLYAAMGLLTTGVFWGVQTAAFLAFGTRAALYAGGAVGLGIGYAIKYRLDARYVFPAEAREPAGGPAGGPAAP